MIHSFDIFDTCLVRKCGMPSEIFRLLAYKILGNDAEESKIYDFIKIRMDSEKNARKNSRRNEITIFEIYDICDFSKLTNDDNESILNEELRIEEEQIVPVALYKNKILDIHNSGEKVIYISDIYLPSNFIKKLLIKNGLWGECDILIVSSDFFETKCNGNLYKILRNRLGIITWKHTGDNRRSDIINAVRNFIIPSIARTQYSSSEKKIIKRENYLNFSELLKLSSISRAIRLSSENCNPYHNFAIDFIAPLFVPFVYEILENAVVRNINHLYFIARDGYIFYEIAKEIKDSFPSINLHYLYASRKSLYFPCIKDITVNSISEYLGDTDNLDIILYKLGLEEERDAFKGISSKKDFLEIISRSNFLMQLIICEHRKQKELLIDYLKQEGVASLNNSALVDLRGTRKCHSMMNQLLHENGYKPLFGYYMEVEEDRIITDCNKQDLYHAHIYREQLKYNGLYNSMHFINNILEQYFCITPYKRTTGYKRNLQTIIPVFENDAANEKYARKVSNINIEVACCFARFYNEILFNANHRYMFNAVLRQVISYFDNPSRNDLAIFRDFVITGSSIEYKRFLSKLTIKDLFSKTKISSIYWIEGSLLYYYHLPIKYVRICKKIAKKILR